MVWILLVILSPLMQMKGTDVHEVHYLFVKDIYGSEQSCLISRDNQMKLDGVYSAFCMETKINMNYRRLVKVST